MADSPGYIGRLRMVPKSLWVLVVQFAVFSLLVPNFFAVSNFENILRVSSILMLASLGQAIAIILAGVEFSVGSAVALCSIVAVFAVQSVSVPMAFAAGFVIVLVIGAINGTLIAYAKLPPFLATLAMLMLVHGVASLAVGGLPIEAPVSESFYWMGRGKAFGIPVPILLAAFGLVVHYILLSKTTFGRQIYLVGSNERAAHLSGIAVNRIKFLGYVAAAGFVAVSGLILTSRVASGQPNLIPNLPFETISACAVGGLSLAGGRGSTLQVLVGVLIIAMLNNSIVLLNLPTAFQLAVLGFVIIAAVVLQTTPDRFSFLSMRAAFAQKTKPQGDA